MAATPKKGVLVPVNDERKHGAAAPAALAQKLASPAKAASKEALRERMEAAAVRRDIELEQRQFRAHNSAIPKGEVAAPGASKASLEHIGYWLGNVQSTPRPVIKQVSFSASECFHVALSRRGSVRAREDDADVLHTDRFQLICQEVTLPLALDWKDRN